MITFMRTCYSHKESVQTTPVYRSFNASCKWMRQRSEKFSKSQTGSTTTYAFVSGNNRQDDGFEYDLVGNILKILHRVNDCGINGSVLGSNALDREFEYDPLNRLLSATGRESGTQNQNDYLYADAPAPGTPNANNVQAYTRKYQYDKMGNVLQVKQQGSNGFTRKFGYITDVNTLEKISDNSDVLIEDFTYDACGNQLTAGVSRHYIWTAANRLLVYKNQTGSSDPTIFAQYDYDGAGNRISKLVRTGTAGNPVYERTIYIDGIFEYHKLENGTTYEKNYVHIMDASAGSAQASRIAMVRVGDTFPDDISESITYHLENQIKSSSARLDTNGTVIDREEYCPFGDSSLRTFSKKRYRYVGKEKDMESGLYYYGARYYSAWTCRFISVDALAKKYNQLTPYQNAGNNPINDRDIDGNKGEKTAKGGGGDKGGKGDKSKGEDGDKASSDNIEIHTDEPLDINSVGDLLPSTAEDGTRIDIVTSNVDQDKYNDERIVNTFDQDSGTWNSQYQGTYKEDLDPHFPVPAGGVNKGQIKNVKGNSTAHSPDTNETQSNSNISDTTPQEESKQPAKTNSVEKANEMIGPYLGPKGAAAKAIETFAEDQSIAPKLKSKDVPNLTSWNKQIKGFKKAAEWANKFGRFLGISSAISNVIDAVGHARGGHRKKALISIGKAAVDIGMLYVKATPVGLFASLIWGIGSNYIK